MKLIFLLFLLINIIKTNKILNLTFEGYITSLSSKDNDVPCKGIKTGYLSLYEQFINNVIISKKIEFNETEKITISTQYNSSKYSLQIKLKSLTENCKIIFRDAYIII